MSIPKTTASLSMSPRQGIKAGWILFWVSVGALIRRRGYVDAYLYHEERR